MKISLQKLSTKNLATFAQRVLSSSKSGNYKIVENHPLLDILEKKYVQYDEIYTKQTYSKMGKLVAEADEKRDKSFVAIKNFLWGYQQVSSAPNADKAKDLYETLKQFGTNIDRLNYAEETAQLKKLIEEFDKTENKEKLTALSLTTAFDELKAYQKSFETIFAEQAEANAELRKLPSATSIRKELEKSLKAYLDFLSAMQSLTDWNALYLDINELAKSARNS